MLCLEVLFSKEKPIPSCRFPHTHPHIDGRMTKVDCLGEESSDIYALNTHVTNELPFLWSPMYNMTISGLNIYLKYKWIVEWFHWEITSATFFSIDTTWDTYFEGKNSLLSKSFPFFFSDEHWHMNFPYACQHRPLRCIPGFEVHCFFQKPTS